MYMYVHMFLHNFQQYFNHITLTGHSMYIIKLSAKQGAAGIIMNNFGMFQTEFEPTTSNMRVWMGGVQKLLII